jgi:hypothetical protein
MSDRRTAVDEGLLQRVYSEFLEMPGLLLTCQQAQRLWALDEYTCLRLLELLVEAKFLYRSPHGVYMRLSDGSAANRQGRLVQARIDDPSPRRKEGAT